MPDYQLGKIYRIVCNTTGLTYYGSTCEPTLARRLAGHVGQRKQWLNGKIKTKCTSIQVLENDNYTIVLAELYSCNNIMELHQRERFFIENYDCVNIQKPTRTHTEYNIEHKEHIAKLHSNNYQKNREVRLLQSAENREKNKESLSLARANNREKLNAYNVMYRANNIEKIMLSRAEYRLKNKDKLRDDTRERRLKQKELKANQTLGETVEGQCANI
jgi:hypothetical protein